MHTQLSAPQTVILHELLFAPSVRFAQLQKASGLSSDHFNFYLKQLLQQKLVVKNEQGAYCLSPSGKEFANRFDTQARVVERQPKVAVCLVITQPDGKTLAQQRLKQPFYGYWGRPTGKIGWGETVLQAAARELKEETSLQANLHIAEINHKKDYNSNTGELLEDKLFFMVHGSNPTGKLLETFEGGRNAWMTPNELASQPLSFLGADSGLVNAVTHPPIKVVEWRCEYSPAQY